MQIDIKGRNTPVTDDLRLHVERRFRKVARQVPDLARLEIEIQQEQNPAIPECEIAQATLSLKGVTLRARDASRDVVHSINMVADDLARQVKRDRDKRRRRREARGAPTPSSAPAPV